MIKKIITKFFKPSLTSELPADCFTDVLDNFRLESRRATVRHFIHYFLFLLFIIGFIYQGMHKTTVLVPYNLTKKVRVASTRADDQYLSSLAIADSNLYFNYTPKTVKQQTSRFLSRVAASEFGQVQLAMLKREKMITKEGYSQWFVPSHTTVDQQQQRVVITGQRLKFVAYKKMTAEPQKITITIDYDFNNGYVTIKGWDYHAGK